MKYLLIAALLLAFAAFGKLIGSGVGQIGRAHV